MRTHVLSPNGAYHPAARSFITITPHSPKSPHNTDGACFTHIVSHPLKPPLPVSWLACHPGASLSPACLADRPSARRGPTIPCFEFKVILIPDPPPAPARLPLASIKTCLCMYVCAEGNTGRAFFFSKGWGGGDKQRNLRSVNMDGVPAFREHR